eukprot:COSAG01_NODE_1209_length_11232_cov_5.378818_9_plen_1014_part_00
MLLASSHAAMQLQLLLLPMQWVVPLTFLGSEMRLVKKSSGMQFPTHEVSAAAAATSLPPLPPSPTSRQQQQAAAATAAGPFGISMALMYYAPRDAQTIKRLVLAAQELGGPLAISVCIDHGDSDPAHDPRHGTEGAIVPVCHANSTSGATMRSELQVLRAAGAKVMHYVHSRQLYRGGEPAPCCRCCDSLSNVTRRVDTELAAFPNDGIFTDNVVADAAHYEFFSKVQKRARISRYSVMNANCHRSRCQKFDPRFIDLADVSIVWEGYVSSPTAGLQFDMGALDLPPLTPAQQEKLAVMVYNGSDCDSPAECARDPTSWRSIVDRARAFGVHKFWVAGPMHAEGPLPPYFEKMVEYIATLNRNHSGDAERLTPTLEIFPATSKKVPLMTRSLQFTATKSLKDVANSTQYFLIETIPPPSGHDNSSYDYTSMSLWLCASTHSPSVVVAPLVDTISDGPFPAMNVVGSVQIRVSAYAAKNGQRLGTSVPHTIYFDLRYSTLRHQLQVERGAHNRVHLTAVPEDSTLGKLTQSATFDTFSLSKSGKWTPNRLYKQNHTERNGQTHYTFQFGSPGIVFVGMVYSTNAFDLHATRAAPSTFDGIFAQPAPLDKMDDGSTVFNPIAVVVPFSNGTVPQPPHSFTGQMIKLEPVPGDLQLCLKHRKLTVLGGPPATGVNFLKLCGVDASAKHMALKLAEGFSVLPAPGSYTDKSTQNVSKLADNVWMISGVFFESVQLALKADASLINVTTQIQLAIFGGSQMPVAGSTAWQNVQVSVVPWPAVNTPKHLVTAITDAPAAAIQDMVVMDKGERILGLYRRLGMSVFPTQSSNAIDPRNPFGSHKGARFYFPANRTSPDWAALRYGVEHGTFGNGFNGDGLFCLASGKTGGIGCPVDPNSSALKGLSPEAKAAELLKWENAVAFHNLTGQLDLSYDGFLLNNSFENLNLVTSLVKPDYVFTDAEHFPSLQLFTDTIGAHTSVAFASAEHCAAFFHCHPTAIVQAYLRTLKLVVALVSRIAR